MGIRSWFRRDAQLSDDQLRDRIFDAIARDDSDLAIGLLQEHQQRVRMLFRSWTTVPERIRDDPRALDAYVRSVVTVAEIFERSGDPSLVQSLSGPGDDDLISRLTATLKEAQCLADEEHFGEAIELLEPLVAELRELRGSFADSCLARACGTLGVAMMRTGRRDQAIQWTERARDACAAAGDEEGVEVYSKNLRFIRDWHDDARPEDDDPSEWDHVAPEELLRQRGTVTTRDAQHLFGRRAAARALHYGRGGGHGYDEIAFRIFAATPATAGAHFHSAFEIAARRRSAQDAPTTWPRIGDSHAIRLARVGQSRESEDDLGSGQFTFRIQHRATFDPSARESMRSGDQLLDLAEAPEIFAPLASPYDAPLLASQRITANVPAMRWVPLPLLLATGRFRPMQEWATRLECTTRPRADYSFVSHRWLTAHQPDPDGAQAAMLAWQLVAHLCDAIRVAATRGLGKPRMMIRRWNVAWGVAASDLGESLLSNLVRPRVDEEALKALHAETETMLPLVMDYGIGAGRADSGLDRLRSMVGARPALTALLEHVFVWYDYSCLPQPPLTDDEAAQLRTGLELLEAYQRFGRTVVLLDDGLDYVSRAWCTFEAMVASDDFELLVGSRRAAARQAHSPDEALGTMLSHRRFLVWRGVLDTEVFRSQSVPACMERLGVTATEEKDLPFLYSKYRGLGMPTSVVFDSSEIVTGTFPLPVADGEALLSPLDLDPEASASATETLDWTTALRLGEWLDGESGRYPSFLTVADEAEAEVSCHVVVTGSCEGEAIVLARFVLGHLVEAEGLMGRRCTSLSWLAGDVAPVGHMQEGRLSVRPVSAKRWLFVGLRGRLVGCKATHRVVNSAVEAGVHVATLAVDEAKDNVSIGLRAQRREAARRIALDALTAFRPHDRGLYRDAIWRHLF